MFTGIIQDIGTITTIQQEAGGDRVLEIQTRLSTERINIGDSICCQGVCLTVISKKNQSITAKSSNETLRVTTLKTLEEGDSINLEPALKVGDSLGGHIVTGHVDGTVEVLSREQDGESWRFQFSLPTGLAPFIASKGSVTLNGVSLTVNEVEADRFGINIIPHTYEHTTFGQLAVGEQLNLEIDMLARYVARLLETTAKKAA